MADLFDYAFEVEWRDVEDLRNTIRAFNLELQRMEILTIAAGEARWETPDARRNIQTRRGANVTMTMAEAMQLISICGPAGLITGANKPMTRLLTSMYLLHEELRRTFPEGKSLGVVAALQVLQAAINDQLFECRGIGTPERAPMPRLKKATGPKAGTRRKAKELPKPKQPFRLVRPDGW
jgi:hypothetical protein